MKPPKELDAAGRRKWRELLPVVAPRGELAPGTADALCMYCSAWSRWQAATDDDARIRWGRAVRQWAAELRLTPRSMRQQPEPPASERERDPLLRILRGPKHG